MTIQLVKDSCGDLPQSLVGQKAEIISRNKLHDEMGIKAYNVKFFSRKKKIHVLWEDEFIYVDQPKGEENAKICKGRRRR